MPVSVLHYIEKQNMISGRQTMANILSYQLNNQITMFTLLRHNHQNLSMYTCYTYRHTHTQKKKIITQKF